MRQTNLSAWASVDKQSAEPRTPDAWRVPYVPEQREAYDGIVIVMRRLLRKDAEKNFHEFFQAVPQAERMFIKHRVTDAQVIREWAGLPL